MEKIYRLYTNKTIGFFKNKTDALSLLIHINNSKIEVFSNTTPIGTYSYQNNQLYFNDIIVNDEEFSNILKWYNDKSVIIETNEENNKKNKDSQNEDLNLFIPLTLSEKRSKVEKREVNIGNVNKIEVRDINEIEAKIKMLELEAKLQEEEMNEKKRIIEEKNNEVRNKKKNFDRERKNYEKDKDEWDKLRNKLEADKRVYFIIKEQLDNGELTEESIPILFQEKFPIFKYLDTKNLINDDDTISTTEINNYLDILPNFEEKKTNADRNNSLNDMFSSSDPIYEYKNFNKIIDSNDSSN